MNAAPADGLDLVLAVVTYRRPADLEQLLPMLLEQAGRAACAPRAPVRRAIVVVVDNDPHASARDIVAAHDPALVRYVVEPKPGIAAARNRALDEAAGADLLAFIDDDERPSEQWITALLDVWNEHRVAAVTGPVRSIVDGPLDPWLAAGGMFDRRHRANTETGTRLPTAATNNLLLDLRRQRAHGWRFADELGLGNGEDTLFTRTIVASGEHIIWCAEARVLEKVRPDRLSRRWALARAFSYGTADVQVELVMAADATARVAVRLRCVGAGVARAAYGAARTVVGLVTGSLHHRALGAQTMMRGAGLLAGSLGYVKRRYRTQPT